MIAAVMIDIVFVKATRQPVYGMWTDDLVGITEDGNYAVTQQPNWVFPTVEEAIAFGEAMENVIVDMSDACHIMAFGIDAKELHNEG